MRNRRRTVSSILGVLLAVTFVAGTFIAIDSSARATLDATLIGLPGDFSFYLNTFGGPVNYSRLQADLGGVAGVVDASVYRSLYVGNLENPTLNITYSSYISAALGIDPNHLPYIMRDAVVNGSLDLQRGEVGLAKGVAAQLRVVIGDRVVAVNVLNSIRYEVNLTVRAVVEPTHEASYDPMLRSFPQVGVDQVYANVFLFVHIRDADWLDEQLNQTGSGSSVFGEVWIDRAHYVNPYDPAQTQRNLERIQRRLQTLVGPDGYVSDNILPRIQNFTDRIASLRIQYLLLSMPVVLLGVYLGAVGVDLSHAERRRELAILKTRGARKGQLIGLLILEAVVGGLFAAILGLAAGVALSRFLLGVMSPEAGGLLPYDAFVLTPDTVLIVGFLAVALMGAVAYRSAKRTSSLPIIESLRYHSPGETKIHYSPRTDVILVSVGVADYVLVWWRGGVVTNLWTYLLGLIPFILLPFVPIMLIVGLTRLLTRSTGRVYDVFSRVTRLLSKDLAYIIRKNLSRNPRRSANVAIIIALGLAFGVFSLSLLATNNTHTAREIRATIGADMAVFPVYGNTDLTANLSAVPGVAGASEIESFSGVNPGYCCAQVFGFDPDSYFAVAQPEFWAFRDGSAQTAHAVLATVGQVLISEAYYDQAFLEVGDRLALSMTAYDQNGSYVGTVRENVTVGGVVRFLPGVGYGLSQVPAIYGSLATLSPFEGIASSVFGPSTVQYLVDLAPGADWRSVKAAILSQPTVGSVLVVDEQIEQQSSNPFYRALYGFIAMEIAFIVVILTAGVGLILYAASLERDVEFAAIIARGSSGWQTARLLVGEALVIMLVGLVVGVSVGLGTAFFATQFLAAGPPGSMGPAVPYLFVFPWDAVLLVTLGPAAILLAALVVSGRTAHLNVAQVLKLRSG